MAHVECELPLLLHTGEPEAQSAHVRVSSVDPFTYTLHGGEKRLVDGLVAIQIGNIAHFYVRPEDLIAALQNCMNRGIPWPIHPT